MAKRILIKGFLLGLAMALVWNLAGQLAVSIKHLDQAPPFLSPYALKTLERSKLATPGPQ